MIDSLKGSRLLPLLVASAMMASLARSFVTSAEKYQDVAFSLVTVSAFFALKFGASESQLCHWLVVPVHFECDAAMAMVSVALLDEFAPLVELEALFEFCCTPLLPSLPPPVRLLAPSHWLKKPGRLSGHISPGSLLITWR